MGKPIICIGENKVQISFAVTAKLISAFVFATQIVQSLSSYIQNFKLLACFCDCTAQFVTDLEGTQIDGFLTHRLKYLLPRQSSSPALTVKIVINAENRTKEFVRGLLGSNFG